MLEPSFRVRHFGSGPKLACSNTNLNWWSRQMASNAQASSSQTELPQGTGGNQPTPTPQRDPPPVPSSGTGTGDIPQPGTPRMRTIVAREFTHMLKSSLPANWRVKPSAASVAHAARQQGIPVDRVQATVVVVPDSALGAAYCQWLWAQPFSDECQWLF